MKVGIISDIHGNYDAMQKALSLLNSHHVDKIVCAGDLVDGENETDQVVKVLRDRKIPCVQGNHDRDAFVEQAQLRRLMKQNQLQEHELLLESSTVAYLSSLPLRYEFEMLDVKICLAHGTPDNNVSYLFPESSLEKFLNVTQQTDADIIILGHTHVPMFVKCGEIVIVNVGSIHRNRYEDTQTCGILELPNKNLSVFDLNTEENVGFQRLMK